MSESNRADVVRREFAREGPSFASPGSFFGRADIAAWIGDHLPLRPGDTVLDVCGGAGHLSRALAARAARFVVLDLTPDQIAIGREAGAPRRPGQRGVRGGRRGGDAPRAGRVRRRRSAGSRSTTSPTRPPWCARWRA